MMILELQALLFVVMKTQILPVSVSVTEVPKIGNVIKLNKLHI